MSEKQDITLLTALWDDGAFEREDAECADADLRRLHEVNHELLEALQKIAGNTYDEWTNGAEAGRIARAAIAKATGEEA